MMHVRRAPREVYRVYSEDEFFGGDELLSGGVADERRVRSAAGADQRWHTVAGVTIVAAALGAIGGVVALTWVAPAPRGGRRATAGLLLAAAGSLGPSNLAGTRVWRDRSNAESSPPRGVAVQRVAAARARRRAGTPVRAVGARRSPGVVAREQDTQIVALTPAGYEVAAVTGPGGGTGTVSAPSAAPQPLHPTHAAAPEFGFER
jgi:hypothetical protein